MVARRRCEREQGSGLSASRVERRLRATSARRSSDVLVDLNASNLQVRCSIHPGRAKRDGHFWAVRVSPKPPTVIGADAETQWLPAEIARDASGYVLTGDDVVKAGQWSRERDPYLLETSVPGVFACGDVRLSPVKRVASAVGEGSMAIALVQQYLQRAAKTIAVAPTPR